MTARLCLFLCALRALAQSTCPSTPAWSTCEITFDLAAGESAAELRAEFRSPHHRTYLMYAFHDGDRRLVIRFAPTEGGAWTYKVTSSIPRLDGKEDQFTAADSDSPGFIRVANVHHFATENNKPHLWMATPVDRFLAMPRAEFDQTVAQRAKEKFTHLRVVLEAGADLKDAFERMRAINAKGLTVDLAFASIPEDAKERDRYLAEMVSRFAGLNVTWMGVPQFENVEHARAIFKDAGELIKKYDPYNHPRTTLAAKTSSPLLGDAWMTVAAYGTPDENIGAVEHQLYQAPAINSGIRSERDLWMATMNGQYPASGSGQYMTAWLEFMENNRYWELEPYFEVDGGRAIALDGVEYIVYVERAGPVEVTVEKHGYDVAWINPQTGERIKQKNYSGEHFTGEPPDKSHGWVLHISREGTKEGMLRSYKFESRPVPVQEVEQNAEKIPYDVAGPAGPDMSLASPGKFAIKVKRETRATRSLLVEWMAEVIIDGEGYRVAGTGREGTLEIPRSIVGKFPAVLSLRMAMLNANGKAYLLEKVYRLNP
jgi:Domain of unknown function (DUF5060)